MLVPNWEKAPVGGNGKENLRAEEYARLCITREGSKRVNQKIQVDQSAALQQPESNCVIAQHRTAMQLPAAALTKEANVSPSVLA